MLIPTSLYCITHGTGTADCGDALLFGQELFKLVREHRGSLLNFNEFVALYGFSITYFLEEVLTDYLFVMNRYMRLAETFWRRSTAANLNSSSSLAGTLNLEVMKGSSFDVHELNLHRSLPGDLIGGAIGPLGQTCSMGPAELMRVAEELWKTGHPDQPQMSSKDKMVSGLKQQLEDARVFGFSWQAYETLISIPLHRICKARSFILTTLGP